MAEKTMPVEEKEPAAPETQTVSGAKGAAVNAEVAKLERQSVSQIRQQRKVRIIIPSGRDEYERSPVPVGVNGYTALIKRDVEVDVPEGVVNVLKLAKQMTPVQDTDAAGHTTTTFKETPRFPLQILGYVDPKTGKLVGEA